MLQKILVAIVLAFWGSVVFAAISSPGFKAGTIDETKYLITVSPDMEQIEPRKIESQSYDFAFKEKNGKYEIRYISFVETENIQNIKAKAGFWSYLVSMNIAGDEKSIKKASNFKDNDVKHEFNADYGSTVFIADSKSDFSEGYKYIMANFYYKKGVGMMCQTILFNDLSITKSKEFNNVFHSFKFLEE